MRKILFIIFIGTLIIQENTVYAKHSSKITNVIPEYNKETDIIHTLADSIVNFAKAQLGVKYKLAGTSPKTGFDCSGFLNYVFDKFNYKLPKHLKDFDNIGKNIKVKNCEKGDLILFHGYKNKKETGHIGIIISNNNGKIKFIHTTSTKGIIISDFSLQYYQDKFRYIRRVTQDVTAQNSSKNNKTTKVENYKEVHSNTLETQTDSIIQLAVAQVGIKYKYAGASPETGFDCSGFVNYVFGKFNYKLPRSSRYFDDVGKDIKLKNCKKGDLILFQGYDVKKKQTGHVGIIISNENGKIKFIHAASSKNRGIVISNFDVQYYKDRFRFIKRIIKTNN